MSESYVKQLWVGAIDPNNPPPGATAATDERFNHMEEGIASAVRKGELAVNVRDFGAVGNGTTDDTVAAQAALDQGGTVVFPAGNYRCAALAYSSGTTLVALGPVTITHIATGGFAGNFPRAMLTNKVQPTYNAPDSTSRVAVSNVARDVTITGPFTFDGAGAAVWGLQFVACDRVTVRGVTVANVKGALDLRAVRDSVFSLTATDIADDGVSITDQNFAPLTTYGRRGISTRILIEDCLVQRAAATTGAGATGKAAYEIDDGPSFITFRNCKAIDNRGTGFQAHVHTTEFDVHNIRYENCVAQGNTAPAGVDEVVAGFSIGQCPAGSHLGQFTYENCTSTGSPLAFVRQPGAQTGVVTDIAIRGGYWESLQAPAGRDFFKSTCIYVGKDFDRFRISGATLAGANDGFGIYTYSTGGELTVSDVTIPDAYTPLYLGHTGGTVALSNVTAVPNPWVSAQSTVCVYILSDYLVIDGLVLKADQAQYGASLVRVVGVDYASISAIVRNTGGAVGNNAFTFQDCGMYAVTGSVINGFTNGVFLAGTAGGATFTGNSFKGCTAKFNVALPATVVEAGNII